MTPDLLGRCALPAIGGRRGRTLGAGAKNRKAGCAFFLKWRSPLSDSNGRGHSSKGITATP